MLGYGDARDPEPTGDPRHEFDPESLLYSLAFNECLGEFLALAFEEVGQFGPGVLGEPPHPGVLAAVEAYQRWKRSGSGPPAGPGPTAAKWVARSEDGRRILAVGDSFEECERAAAAAGFPPDRLAIGRVRREPGPDRG